jgi:solute carrier family 35 protein E1
MASQCPDAVALFLYFFFWYMGNALFNQYNTVALTAIGGPKGGLTMTVSCMQLGVCTLWACLLYRVGWNPIKLLGGKMPERMQVPHALTKEDLKKTMPLGFCFACAHSSAVFALGADPLFGQIVKAGEPVMSGVVNAAFYNKAPSSTKWFCILFIVGGVAFACLKRQTDGGYHLHFDTVALIFGMLANTSAAFKGSENAKLMKLPGVKDRFAGVQNQFAVTVILGFAITIPVMLITEGANFFKFLDHLLTDWEFQKGLLLSGLWFYWYNELAVMTLEKTGAVASSVANTAKRVIVLVWMSIVTGKALTEEQKIGAAVAISFVFVYAVIDDFVAKFVKPRAVAPASPTTPAAVQLDRDLDQLELGQMKSAAKPLTA